MDGHESTGYSGRLIRAGAPQPLQQTGSAVEMAPAAMVVDPHQAEADRVLARAESLAETMISRAEGAAARIREEAEAQATHQRETRLAEELLAFNRKIRGELDDVRPLLARMVIEAVEAIIGNLPEEDIAEKMIRRALRDLDASMQAVLVTSREDFATLSSIIETMRESGENTIRAVQTDPDLQIGTCRLESGGISVALGLRAQLDVLESMLLREEAAERVVPTAAAPTFAADEP